MNFEGLDQLRRNDAAWRLLRADNAPLVLGFLGKVFVDDNVRSSSATEPIGRLDDELHALDERLGDGTFPQDSEGLPGRGGGQRVTGHDPVPSAPSRPRLVTAGVEARGEYRMSSK
ncbi:DUF3375 family protein [Kutzneria sp. NPDC052558]|uniref:DUF3375 family protein n=1 Tax=Kutzneria sp. NPDC052558 TaxID=3364121 RepID=UPI0037C80ABA